VFYFGSKLIYRKITSGRALATTKSSSDSTDSMASHSRRVQSNSVSLGNSTKSSLGNSSPNLSKISSLRTSSNLSKSKKISRDFQVFKLAFFVLAACVIGLVIVVIFILTSFLDLFSGSLTDVIMQKIFEPFLLLMPLAFYLSGSQSQKFFSGCGKS
jgi:hypothetical protein